MKKCIFFACRMIEQEIRSLIKEVDFPYPIYFIPPNLHATPEKLQEYLQNAIDNTENVDAIIISVGRCGNSTIGLKASTADLILPRCDDCIDILLSKGKLAQRVRPEKGCFLTESWVKNTDDLDVNMDKLTEKYGEFEAKSLIRTMYYGYKYFYIIDTGLYDMTGVADYILPTAELIDADIKILPGHYNTLRKMMSLDFDDDFIVVPKGGFVTENDFNISL
ncbi:MAG: DUF1638 domain-containing protein [Bacillota bacterium]|nr:DUF1638 domain-containing protein [Bacillota bacterium]